MGGMIPSMPQTPFWHLAPTDGRQKKPFQQEIFLLETYVAGLFFAENLQDVEVFLVPGFRLELLREPQNAGSQRFPLPFPQYLNERKTLCTEYWYRGFIHGT